MKKVAKTTRTPKTPKATIPATLATEWAGTRLPDAELYSAMKSRAMELGQNASNAGRSAREAIKLVDRAADSKALAEVKAAKSGKPAKGTAQEPKTRPTPASKGATYVFQLIETAEYIADQAQQLTPQKAGKINAALEANGSEGRWVTLDAAKQNGAATTIAKIQAARSNGGIPVETADEAPTEHERNAWADHIAAGLTAAAVALLQRLITEDQVTVSGQGLGLAVTAGFLAKKELIALTTIAKDRVATLTENGRKVLDAIANAPAPVRKARASASGKVAPQWVVKSKPADAEKAEWLGRNHTHALAKARADKAASEAGKRIAWATAFSGVGGKVEYTIERVGNGDRAAALEAELRAEALATTA